MAVIKSEEGTTLEAEEQAKAASSEKGGTPDEASKVSPKAEQVEKPIYTQTQADALIHAAKSTAGRLQTDAETERDVYKAKDVKAAELIEDIQDERDRLQTHLDAITSDDPKKFDIIKLDKELRETQRTLKTGAADLATKNQESDERIKSANDTMLEIAIWEVATEFKGSDPMKLKNLCATLGITTEEKLREVAGNLWEKAEPKTPAKKAEDGEPKAKLNLDDGETQGGGGKLTEQEILDRRYPTMKK